MSKPRLFVLVEGTVLAAVIALFPLTALAAQLSPMPDTFIGTWGITG